MDWGGAEWKKRGSEVDLHAMRAAALSGSDSPLND